MALIPVVLAGGSGKRLWPLSRSVFPKQFLELVSDQSMLQETIGRLADFDIGEPIVVCGEEHRFFVAEHCKQIGVRVKIVLEPIGRNTAPAITVAASMVDSNDILLVLPADHHITDLNAFHLAIAAALNFAQDNFFVMFGVTAKNPNTGYGYVEKGRQFREGFEVKRFVEKPTRAKALDYLNTGNYLWNSGMFVFKASVLLSEMKCLEPELVKFAIDAVKNATIDLDFIRLGEEEFSRCLAGSIDYLLLEKTENLLMVELDAGWSDLGSWDAVANLHAPDCFGNVISEDSVAVDTLNTYVRSSSGKIAALVGVKDLVIVDTEDALLVAHKEALSEVTVAVQKLESQDVEITNLHRKVYRPWGWYDSIDSGDHFKVKRICVNPGAKLSLQKHSYRAEHWVVVIGEAEVTCDNKTFILRENESTYIPLGAVHRLANPRHGPLQIIEVQTGTYLGEDDITRYEDDYHRC